MTTTYGPELAAALMRAQKAAKAVGKDGHNKHHGYDYATAEGIISEARAALSDAGLAVMPLSIDCDEAQRDHRWEEATDEKGEKTTWIVQPRRIRATYRLLHESGQYMDFASTTPVIPERGRPEDKAEFGARTENLAYALRDLLLLPRGCEDTPSSRDDTDKPVPKAAGPKAAANGSGKSSGPSSSASPATNQTSSSAAPASQASGPPKVDRQKALNFSKMLTSTAADGGCGLTKDEAVAWSTRRLGKSSPSNYTDEELKAATLCWLAYIADGEVARLAKEAEYVAAGVMKGDPKEQAA